MKRITPDELAEMRARGYERALLDQASDAIARGRIADKLITVISEAFRGVTLGDGVGLLQAQGLDDYEDEATCAAFREGDEKEDWRVIATADLNRCNSSLSFFDAAGMRFHLPAYMIAELRGEYGFGMAFSLTQVGDFERYYSALNSQQRHAVRQFLLFLLNDPDYDFDRAHIERALNDYWVEMPQTE
jgi:hypothetical protein